MLGHCALTHCPLGRCALIQCTITPYALSHCALTFRLPRFLWHRLPRGGGGYHHPSDFVFGFTYHIKYNTAFDSAFIYEQNGTFSCKLCECTSKLYKF